MNGSASIRKAYVVQLEALTPVILAGGSGYRLKPWSRASCPKPFLKIRNVSLLQSTLLRIKGCAPLIVCNQNSLALAQEQTCTVSPHAHFLVEPVMRNTGPAIAAAAAHILAQKGPDALMLVMPSDHAIDQPDILMDAIKNNIGISHGRILSFGVRPRSASGRFGYILPVDSTARFIEKPRYRQARQLIQAGACWNSGIWLARVGTVQALYKSHAAPLWNASQQAVTYARHDQSCTYLEPRYFSANPAVSVDKAVMEKADVINACALDMGWRDLGTWPSMMAHILGFNS